MNKSAGLLIKQLTSITTSIFEWALFNWKLDEGNDQEPIQSNSTSCPRHVAEKEHKQLRRNKVKQHTQKAKITALSQQLEVQRDIFGE